MPRSNKISIIIPALNEAAYLGKLLKHLEDSKTTENIAEIIIVDGGSTDGSLEVVKKIGVTRLVRSNKGRPLQMNAGAKVAKGSVLYFLHADSFPPKGFDEMILREIDLGNIGCFRLRFEQPDHFLLRLASWCTRFNIALFRGGDQSLFIQKVDFEQLNGFNERYMIYEDLDFIKHLYKKRFPFKIIPNYIVTSERKFTENGVWRLFFHFFIIHILYWLKASPETLYQYYQTYIKDSKKGSTTVQNHFEE